MYDKVASHIGYNDEEHTYTNTRTGLKYISVTTLIHGFVPEFKSNYCATYKVLKDALEKHGNWWDFKQAAGGWEEAVGYWEQQAINHPMQLQTTIRDRKQWYLDKWEAEKDNACVKGSAIHNQLEEA